MERAQSVYVVCEFEPHRLGITAALEEHLAPGAVAGMAASIDAMAGDRAAGTDKIFVMDAGLLPALLEHEAESSRSPIRQVLFLGTLPGTHGDRVALVAASLQSRDAVGFLNESGSTERLIEAIQLVGSGTFVCEMDIAMGLRANDLDSELRQRLQIARLSPREQDVLLRVAKGMGNKAIARELYLAEGTVKAHVSHILAKLAAQNRVDLVRFALLLSPETEKAG
jgi:DNA-binding NarL/FixJ family response regulator